MKLPFGLIDGRLVTTAEVPSGRACGAVCPSCLGPLVARKGEILVHHFAHDGHQAGPDGKSPCTRGYHTALQKMAIQLLSDSGELPLPSLTANAQRRSQLLGARQAQRQVVPAGTTLSITQVLYDPVLAPDAKPAVLCTLAGFGPLAIELNLDGPLGPEARAAYARLGISCIEIDFSGIARPLADWLPTVEDIRKLLYSNDVKRQWVYHRDMPATMEALCRATVSITYNFPDTNCSAQLAYAKAHSAQPFHRFPVTEYLRNEKLQETQDLPQYS